MTSRALSTLSESSVAIKPIAALKSLATGLLRLVEGLGHSLSEQIGRLAEQLFGFLLGGGPSPYDPAGTERAPTPGQIPPPPPPGSPCSSGSGSSFGSGATHLLLMGVLASSLILLWGGRFSWLYREFLKPNSALRLVTELPG